MHSPNKSIDDLSGNTRFHRNEPNAISHLSFSKIRHERSLTKDRSTLLKTLEVPKHINDSKVSLKLPSIERSIYSKIVSLINIASNHSELPNNFNGLKSCRMINKHARLSEGKWIVFLSI